MGTINKPIEAWIREDDTLYIGFPEGKPPFAGIQATARANEALEEWDYDIRPSYVEIREHKDTMYVHPDAYPLEEWPRDMTFISRVEESWIEVWKVSVAALDHHRECE
ncbi:hypothetical protein SEA_FORK_21 [Microbacterium phage Fork]|nr:hypothetical protein SEA_FORK_21 [Microbacterium phage Fork]